MQRKALQELSGVLTLLTISFAPALISIIILIGVYDFEPSKACVWGLALNFLCGYAAAVCYRKANAWKFQE